MTFLLTTVDSRGVARLTLSRPGVLNAFDEKMIAQLHASLNQLAADPYLRCLVVASEGRIFCAGADIEWMQRQSQRGFDDNVVDAARFADMLRALHEFPRPVIARVQGHAFGLGVGLVAAADIAIAAVDAQFAVSEAKFGIIPAVIGPYLLNVIGRRHATRLAMECLRISATAALSMGLIHEVVDLAKLDETIETVIQRLLVSGPLALGEIKSLYRQLDGAPIDDAVLELTARTIARLRASEEAREGFAAFLNKRPPAWIPQ